MSKHIAVVGERIIHAGDVHTVVEVQRHGVWTEGYALFIEHGDYTLLGVPVRPDVTMLIDGDAVRQYRRLNRLAVDGELIQITTSGTGYQSGDVYTVSRKQFDTFPTITGRDGDVHNVRNDHYVVLQPEQQITPQKLMEAIV